MMKISILNKIFRRVIAPIFLLLPLAIFITAGAQHSVAAAATTIRVFEEVEVNRSEIFLGEIAQIDGVDQHLIQQLKEVVIGNSPLPSRSRVIEIEYIRLRLKQHGFDLNRLEVHCPPKVEISRGYLEVDRQKIRKIVSDYITGTVLKGNTAARIKDVQAPERIILPRGRIAYRVGARRNTNYLGKTPFSVRFSVDGKFQKKIWVTATIEMLMDVVVINKPLRKHAPITADDIELRQMDLAHLPSDVITDPQTAMGKRARRPIAAKTVLRADLIEMPPLVRRGDIVVMVAESKGLRITALGKAKRKGRLGERIPVQNLDSKKILKAQILDSRTVKIEF